MLTCHKGQLRDNRHHWLILQAFWVTVSWDGVDLRGPACRVLGTWGSPLTSPWCPCSAHCPDGGLRGVAAQALRVTDWAPAACAPSLLERASGCRAFPTAAGSGAAGECAQALNAASSFSTTGGTEGRASWEFILHVNRDNLRKPLSALRAHSPLCFALPTPN